MRKPWLEGVVIFTLWALRMGSTGYGADAERVCPPLSSKIEERIESVEKAVASELPFSEREKVVKDGMAFFKEMVEYAPRDVEGYIGLARMLALHWRLEETQAKLDLADEAFDRATMKFPENTLPYCYWASFLTNVEMENYLTEEKARGRQATLWEKAEWAYSQTLGFPNFQPTATFFDAFLHTLALRVAAGDVSRAIVGYHWSKVASQLFPQKPPQEFKLDVFQTYTEGEKSLLEHRDDITFTYKKGWVAYRNNRFRYEVQFPAGWVIRKEELYTEAQPPFKSSNVLIVELPLVRQRAWRWENAIHPSIRLTAIEMVTALPLKSFSEKWRGRTGVFRGPGTPAPLPNAYAESFLHKEGDITYKGDTVYLVKGNIGYQIVFTTTPDSYKGHRLLFLAFLQSLKLL